MLFFSNGNYAGSELHSFGVPSGIPDASVRTGLSEPFGADCIPGGVSPCGLEAGAPPVDFVLIGPVLPCGCITLPLGLAVVDWSIGFDWAKAIVEADNVSAVVRTIILRGMVHLHGHTLSSDGRLRSHPRPAQLAEGAYERPKADIAASLPLRRRPATFGRKRFGKSKEGAMRGLVPL